MAMLSGVYSSQWGGEGQQGSGVWHKVSVLGCLPLAAGEGQVLYKNEAMGHSGESSAPLHYAPSPV